MQKVAHSSIPNPQSAIRNQNAKTLRKTRKYAKGGSFFNPQSTIRNPQSKCKDAEKDKEICKRWLILQSAIHNPQSAIKMPELKLENSLVDGRYEVRQR